MAIDLETEWQSLTDDEKSLLESLHFPLWCRNRIEQVDNNRFSFDYFPFLEQIYKDQTPKKAIEKSEQMGLTIYCSADSFWNTWRGLNWIYYFPTSDLVTKYVQGRYDVLLANNPEISKLIKDTDNTRIKKIGKGVIYFSGLGAATKEGGKFNVISVPADGETFDEVELMDPKKVKDALGRMSNSPHKLQRFISTPGLPDYGINELFKETDQKYWTIKCEHCGAWNENIDESFPKCLEPGFLACNKCGKKLLPYTTAEWIAKKPEITDFSGYHVSRLYSPVLDVTSFLKDFRKLRSTTEIKDFYNKRLGLPYVDNSQRISAEEILKLCGSKPMDTTGNGYYLGLDVGGYRKGCHAVVLKPGTGGRLFEIAWMGILKDSGFGSDTEIDWLFKQVAEIMSKFGIKKAGVDAMPETRISRALTKKFSRFWMVRYNEHQKGSYSWDEDDKEVQVNRTESMDNSHYLLQKRVGLPKRTPDVEEFASHCEHEVRDMVEDPKTGKREFVWKKIGPNDYRHAFNYAAVMCYDGRTKTQKDTIVHKAPDKIRDLMGRQY